MLIYEVRLSVDAAVAAAYRAWLLAHVPDVLATGCFTRADVFDEPPEAGRVRFAVHYHAPDADRFARYEREHALRLRAEGLALFAGRFTAKRRVLTRAETFAP